MNTLIAHLESIAATDWATLAVIALLCVFACYFVKEYLAQPPMIVFVFPVMLFFGLEAYQLLVNLEHFSPKKIDQWLMWTILASIFGTVVGIGIVGILALLREKFGGRPAHQAKPTRVAR